MSSFPLFEPIVHYIVKQSEIARVLQNDLLIRVRNSDEDAFRVMFTLYAPRVFQFVRNYLRVRTEAEDMVQNTFMRIWEKREMIHPERSIDGFVFTIARNLLIDHFRRTARSFRESPLTQALDQPVLSTLYSDDLLHQHQFEQVYQRALALLPPKRKEIFIYSRHEGLSNNEIANHLGISIKTVENQMTAALAFMRDFLSKEGIGAATFFSLFFIFQ